MPTSSPVGVFPTRRSSTASHDVPTGATGVSVWNSGAPVSRWNAERRSPRRSRTATVTDDLVTSGGPSTVHGEEGIRALQAALPENGSIA